MEKFFQRELNSESIRVVYFGDHYMSDVWASTTCASSDKVRWESIAVIEELANFDKRLEMGVDPQSISIEGHWGPSYFVDVCAETKKV